MKKTYLISGAVVLLVIAALIAGFYTFKHKRGHRGGYDGGHRMTYLFKKADKDDNGLVSMQEFQQVANKMSKRFDDNDDGLISYDEMPKGKKARKMKQLQSMFHLPRTEADAPVNINKLVKAVFEKIDSNQDNALSKDEVITSAKNHAFARLDTNQDGVIDKTEFFNHRPNYR